MPYLPPLNLIRKNMNSWHLTSRLTARSFSESTASRVRSGRCPRQCATLLHGQMYLQEKTPFFCNLATKFFNLSHHFLSMDGWPGDAIFFLWGQPLKIIHKNSAKKRSSPLDFIFDTCASASSSHLFLVGEAEHMWLYPFARTNAFSAKTYVQQTEIDFLSLYVRKFSGKKIWAFFGMIFYSWPHIMPRDPHPLSARFLENSVF